MLVGGTTCSRKGVFTWISWHSRHLTLPVRPLQVCVFAFDHTGAVLLRRLRTGVWRAGGWRWMRWGGEACRSVFRPEGRGRPLSVGVKEFSRVTWIALVCLAWNKEKKYTPSKKIGPLGRLLKRIISGWNVSLCKVFDPFPARKGLWLPSMEGLNWLFWGTKLWYVWADSWYPVCDWSIISPSAKAITKTVTNWNSLF